MVLASARTRAHSAFQVLFICEPKSEDEFYHVR